MSTQDQPPHNGHFQQHHPSLENVQCWWSEQAPLKHLLMIILAGSVLISLVYRPPLYDADWAKSRLEAAIEPHIAGSVLDVTKVEIIRGERPRICFEFVTNEFRVPLTACIDEATDQPGYKVINGRRFYFSARGPRVVAEQRAADGMGRLLERIAPTIATIFFHGEIFEHDHWRRLYVMYREMLLVWSLALLAVVVGPPRLPAEMRAKLPAARRLGMKKWGIAICVSIGGLFLHWGVGTFFEPPWERPGAILAETRQVIDNSSSVFEARSILAAVFTAGNMLGGWELTPERITTFGEVVLALSILVLALSILRSTAFLIQITAGVFLLFVTFLPATVHDFAIAVSFAFLTHTVMATGYCRISLRLVPIAIALLLQTSSGLIAANLALLAIQQPDSKLILGHRSWQDTAFSILVVLTAIAAFPFDLFTSRDMFGPVGDTSTLVFVGYIGALSILGLLSLFFAKRLKDQLETSGAANADSR